MDILATYALGSRKMQHESATLVPTRPLKWLGVRSAEFAV
jgi:hypothetical protein